MSVLIKGLKMPQKGLLEVIIAPDGIAYELDRPLIDTEHASVSRFIDAVELPDHGDLIDRDTLMCEIADWQLAESPDEGRNWWLGKDVTSHEMQYGIYRLLGDVYEEVRDIPAVIPAERSEDPSHPFADSVMMGGM